MFEETHKEKGRLVKLLIEHLNAGSFSRTIATCICIILGVGSFRCKEECKNVSNYSKCIQELVFLPYRRKSKYGKKVIFWCLRFNESNVDV